MSYKIMAALVLCLCGALDADPVVSLGAPFWCVTPDPPYEPQDVRFMLTLGYGDPSNTIGEGIWLTGPGLVDLSSDTDLGTFLALATDSQIELLSVRITDATGHTLAFSDSESAAFGRDYPNVDLGSLDVTGIGLDVLSMSAPAYDIGFRWVAYGIPEPGTLGLLSLGALLRCYRRPSRQE